MKFLITIVTLLATIYSCSGASDKIVISTEDGNIRGIKETSYNGKYFYSFLGVPFAQPPIGGLRFKAPVPVQPWEGVLSTTSMPEYCLQYPFLEFANGDAAGINPIGEEDCLYLNVHTPKPGDHKAKLPVMVSIHGGAFSYGGAQDYHPQVLLDKDIILVVLQYRLGVLGFLSTEDSTMPGNMGLRDQQLALRWVQQNVLHFGGDPDEVTIFGESAGGASTHFHVLSPASKGLFKRAIVQSGTALCPWATSEVHRTYAEKIGNAFRCSLDEGSEAYLVCMQSIYAQYLALYEMQNLAWSIMPLNMVPRVDGDIIPDRPEILVKEGRYNKVDLMMGKTRDEGAMFNLFMCQNPALLRDLEDKFDTAGPFSLILENEPESEKLATIVFQHYFQKKHFKLESSQDERLTRMFGDRFISTCTDLTSILHASDEEISLYLYQLDHEGGVSLSNLYESCTDKNYISHGDDLPYLFYGGSYFVVPLEGDDDLKMREIMLDLWTSFAKTGVPSCAHHQCPWEKATLDKYKHLSLRTKPVMVEDNRRESREFWLSMNLREMKNIAGDRRFNFTLISEIPKEEL